ncbi:MAG: hypothetical protein ACRD4Y_17080, partial [Candidatus Acidiferrales bacterium]
MRHLIFPLAAILLAAATLPARAAEKPRSEQAIKDNTQKVWTNDDMPRLRAEGLISIVGPEPGEATAQPAVPQG